MKKQNHMKMEEYVIFAENISKELAEYINHRKDKDYCHYTWKYRGAAHSICYLKFNVPSEIPVVFHNGSKYYYHFIIKELTNGFGGQFECIGKSNGKYKTFFVPIKKKITKMVREVNEVIKLLKLYLAK